MFNLALFFFTLIFLILATVSDLKSREVSNKLILFFLIFGFFFKLFQGILISDFSFFFLSTLSFCISFIAFYLFWEFGVIAGGDLKLFLVLAVMIPDISLPFNLAIYLLPIFIFFISLVMLLPWLFFYSFYFILKKKLYTLLSKQFFKKDNLFLILDSFLVVFLISLFVSIFTNINVFYLLFLSTIFSFLLFSIKRKRYFYISLLVFYFSFVVIFLISDISIPIFSLFFNILFFVILFNILKQIYSFTKTNILIETKPISKLKEGDLTLYNYYYKNKKLKLIKPLFLTKIKMLLDNSYYKDLKIDSSKAGGLNKQDILFLKTLYKNNLITNKIYLKKTLAFVPAVLLGYLLVILI